MRLLNPILAIPSDPVKSCKLIGKNPNGAREVYTHHTSTALTVYILPRDFAHHPVRFDMMRIMKSGLLSV